MRNKLNRLPAGGAPFCSRGGVGEGFGAGRDGFFSSGGGTLGIQDVKVTTETAAQSAKTRHRYFRHISANIINRLKQRQR